VSPARRAGNTPAPQTTAGEMVEIGRVTRPHGVRGELRVAPHDPASTVLAGVDAVALDGRPYRVASARAVNGAYLLRLDGVGDRNAAEELRDARVSVARDALGLSEDDILLVDLVGCAVFLEDGSPWGEVVEVSVGPQDRLVIHDGSVERLLPLVDAFVVAVDVDNRRIVVAPPDGLPESPI
jgi:16S rRNA processing protein RimM